MRGSERSRAEVVPADSRCSEVLHSRKENKLCTQDQGGARDQQSECEVSTGPAACVTDGLAWRVLVPSGSPGFWV